MKIKAIVTIPPYADFIDEVLSHPIVSGLRLNTVMPIKGSLEDTLTSLYKKTNNHNKKLWIDLKCRQLRIKDYGVPPFTEISLTHNIKVKTPVKAYFSDGNEVATIVKVDKNKLYMQEGPKRVVGPGESINIIDNSLEIEGYFTNLDKEYVKACEKIGIKNYMLSFVEKQEDINNLLKYVSDANIVAKIESEKGLNFINNDYKNNYRLMAARGDLFVEVEKPHKIVESIENILNEDKNAIVASRIFPSLTYSFEPSCEDIGDVDNLLRMGYKSLMLGDDICMKRDSVISALNLLYAMSKKYNK